MAGPEFLLGPFPRPAVTDIGLTLFVAGAITVLDADEVVALVKGAGSSVRFERPEVEALRLAILDVSQQLVADAPAGPGGVDVQLIEPSRFFGAKADDNPGADCHRDCMFGQQNFSRPSAHIARWVGQAHGRGFVRPLERS